ncbi:ATP-binding protein [Candidatus Parabeggiatoa sp. HSG14]|uniref:AAA family ATPase n=1 Tax=Candidatus Parabeggiatoa sp. HSG14 TaxID=3055593 RepID=UPI0025A74A60|nr:ATP-binding protein [Thiotrichales bacterium HSG14]
MFKQIHIKNFLSCQDVVIDNMGSMTVLIGRNGSGKTNILKTIWWITNIISPQPIKTSREENTEIDLLLELDNTQYYYKLKILPNSTQDFLNEKLAVQIASDKWKTLFHRQQDTIKIKNNTDEIKVGSAMPSLSALIALLPQESTLRKPISSIVNFLQTVRYYPIDETQLPREATTLFTHSNYVNWLNKSQNQFDVNSSVIMRLLHLSLERQEEFEEIKTLVGQEGLDIIKDIKVDTITHPPEMSDKSNVFYHILFQPSHSSERLHYHNLSFGTRRLLRIIVSVIYDKSAVLLLEQPEDGIHIGLLHKIIPLLKSYSDQGQFILASHSPEVLNRLEPQEIRLVTMENSITSLRSLDKVDIATAHQFIREQGTLSDFIETIQED